MKKIVSGLIAVFMVATGLVAFSGSAANAACPYGGCVPTYTKIHARDHIRPHHRARICVGVSSDGNGTPRGHVTVRVVKRNGTDRYQATHRYRGGLECFHTTRLHRGRYTITAKFDRKAGSRWKDSNNRKSLGVHR